MNLAGTTLEAASWLPFELIDGEFRPRKIEIRHGTSKGVSLIASEDLKPGQIFPYGGIRISRKEYETRMKNRSDGKADYILFGDLPDGSDIIIDGHPRHRSGNTVCCTGSLVNEATEGTDESFNCVIRAAYPSETATKPDFFGHIGELDFVVEIMATIKSGVELLAPYGYGSVKRCCYHTLSSSLSS